MTTEQKEEGWEKHWEIANRQLENGVNPHAYRLGFLDQSREINDLKLKFHFSDEIEDQLQLRIEQDAKQITDLKAEIERLKDYKELINDIEMNLDDWCRTPLVMATKLRDKTK